MCRGNTCRSPMAEGIARWMLGQRVEIESAGTHAHVRDPPAANAVKVMREKFGSDISKHRSRSVNDVHIDDFDYVVPMDDDVHDYLRANFPNLGEKLLPSWGIEDPYGCDLFTYEETAVMIQKHMQELATFINENEK